MVDFASDSDPPTATQPGFWGLAIDAAGQRVPRIGALQHNGPH